MTAEVAILNREAVALAADSAVTLMGLEERKIYNTNKLFDLSPEPVAVMIYGSADFGMIPWESVVQEYRRKFASTCHDTIENCALEFMEHLTSFVDDISVEKQNEQVKIIAMMELQSLRLKIAREPERDKHMDKSFNGLRYLVLECINDRIQELENMYHHIKDDAPVDRKPISLFIDDWAGFIDRYLDGLPTNDEIIQRAATMVEASLKVLPSDIWLPWRSGIVITGFGHDQLFPKLLHYSMDGVIAGKVRTRQLDSQQITEQQPSYIQPFGQDDMVLTFLHGIDPAYTRLLNRYRTSRNHFYERMVMDLLQHFEDRAKSPLSSAERSDLLEKTNQMRAASLEELDYQIDSHQSSHYKEIRSMVEWLPKNELAEMAETLVNLTSFKRRVTPQAETVGGPIDVAVISKGDGFVWIKRKNYFDPKLNPQFLERARIDRKSQA